LVELFISAIELDMVRPLATQIILINKEVIGSIEFNNGVRWLVKNIDIEKIIDFALKG